MNICSDYDYSVLAKDLAWQLYIDHPNIHGAGWYIDKAENLEDLPSEITAYYIEWAYTEIEGAKGKGKAGIERIRWKIKDAIGKNLAWELYQDNPRLFHIAPGYKTWPPATSFEDLLETVQSYYLKLARRSGESST